MAAKPTKKTPVADYRYDDTRKNIPTAALASQGQVSEIAPQRYHYDPHLPPALRFDDTGEADRLPELLETAKKRPLNADEAETLAQALRGHEPWLEWSGKREKRWFEVDPVALHIHERVSAKAVMRIAARQDAQRSLWADPEQPYHEAVQFYQHDVDWANRLILGDSLSVMNSLAVREDLAGKVQMIYIDPPYGTGFRSNFQPFVRNRNVTDKETDLPRSPEVVKAYRDAWTLGVHTYLAYLRDRLTVARDLLTDSGSIFVQIGDENVHRVRAVMDEVFGSRNFVSLIAFMKTTGSGSTKKLPGSFDLLLLYARDKDKQKYRQLYLPKVFGGEKAASYVWIESPDRYQRRRLTSEEQKNRTIPQGWKLFSAQNMTSQAAGNKSQFPVTFQNKTFIPTKNQWKTNPKGMDNLIKANRLIIAGASLNYVRFQEDSPIIPINNTWTDTAIAGFSGEDKIYAVQTAKRVIQRCILMTTDPGDLVLDPTCGSGTTAYVAEQWGRRWITIDTSRVAMALARERILTAKFDCYEPANESDGGNGDAITLGGGFRYKTAPHVTLKSIAQNVALDSIFARWEPILDDKLAALNAALAQVDAGSRAALRAKLTAKRGRRGRENRVTDADERRWNLPKNGWEHWEVPFDADPDYPPALRDALDDYRKAWRGKMKEVNACIAANADQEELVDQPEVRRGVVRVSGPFTVESVHPPEESLGIESPIGGAPEEMDGFPDDSDAPSNAQAFHDTIIRLLRKDGIRFQGNGVAAFTRLEPSPTAVSCTPRVNGTAKIRTTHPVLPSPSARSTAQLPPSRSRTRCARLIGTATTP